jgi:hypothetical protein
MERATVTNSDEERGEGADPGKGDDLFLSQAKLRIDKAH